MRRRCHPSTDEAISHSPNLIVVPAVCVTQSCERRLQAFRFRLNFEYSTAPAWRQTLTAPRRGSGGDGWKVPHGRERRARVAPVIPAGRTMPPLTRSLRSCLVDNAEVADRRHAIEQEHPDVLTHAPREPARTVRQAGRPVALPLAGHVPIYRGAAHRRREGRGTVQVSRSHR
jgi:hypothetical protein